MSYLIAGAIFGFGAGVSYSAVMYARGWLEAWYDRRTGDKFVAKYKSEASHDQAD